MPRAVDTRQLKIEHDPTLNGNEFHLQIRARQEQMLAEMWKTLAGGAYKTVVDIIKDLTGIDLSTWESFLTGMMPQFPNLSIEKVIDDAGDNIQDFFDGVVSTLLGGFRFGQTGNQAVSAIAGVNTTAVTAQYTVRTLQTIYALRSQRPLWQTVDGSAECSVPIVISENLINVTSATIKGGFIRCQGGEEKTSVTFAGYKTGTISSAYLDIYRLETNGSMTLLYSSPDWSSELQTAAALYQHVFAEEDQKGILTELGDNYGIQFRVGGSGTLVLRGRTMTPIAPLAGFRPLRLGFSRPSGTPAPATIPAATMDTLYTDDIPFIGFGGIDEILPRSLFDPFTDTKVRYVYRSLQTGIGFFDTQPVISNGLMSFSGFTDGYQSAMIPIPTSSDQSRVALRLGTAATARASCVTMCSSNDWTNYVMLAVVSGQVQIRTGTALNTTTTRATANVATAKGDVFYLAYTIADSTYRLYKNPNWDDLVHPPVALTQWVDSGAVVKHGPNQRFGAIRLERSSFVNSAPVDDVLLEDWNPLLPPPPSALYPSTSLRPSASLYPSEG